MKRRAYISIYFADGETEARKRRDLTIAMDESSELWQRCRELGSAGIKQIAGVRTYRELVTKARKADRSLGGYIKYRLKKYWMIN